MARSTDTIFAAASGHGRAAVCVIRLSGVRTWSVIEALAGEVPAPRRLSLRRLRAPQTGEVLDESLVAWMPGPASFTGEDQAELHVHGGLATRTGVLRALASLDGCRVAEPGEFTRRAFLNGRMTLDAVEGLADLVEAETEVQRRQALRQLDGQLGRQVERWRDQLLDSLALLEASLDFSDEDDVSAESEASALRPLAAVAHEIATALDDGRRGERLREGFVVVLAGSPNSGKSTLLNALARRDVAIVSPIPGTTRDAIEVRCDIDGLPVVFVDTAGLRESEDPVERVGIARTRARIGGADLVLWLSPVDERTEQVVSDTPVVRIWSKADLAPDGIPAGLAISARDGWGLDLLLATISERASAAIGAGVALITRERHRAALERTQAALRRAVATRDEKYSELVTEDVRVALHSLGEITGHVDVERLLDRIFAAFCIGK